MRGVRHMAQTSHSTSQLHMATRFHRFSVKTVSLLCDGLLAAGTTVVDVEIFTLGVVDVAVAVAVKVLSDIFFGNFSAVYKYLKFLQL